MSPGKTRVCPVEKAGSLDNRLRRWLQNPVKLLSPYITGGMTILDFGCGPGYFTVDMAQMVGETGRIIAADLQEEMLEKLRRKIQGTELAQRITFHKCEENRIGLSEIVDFALVFYVIHELPNRKSFFQELASIVRPGGRVLVVEPPFHVSRAAFEETIEEAAGAGFKALEGPKSLFSKTAVLQKKTSA
jgi:ubiquinone/menaquinone biosynthesis C-methylase UbiE